VSAGAVKKFFDAVAMKANRSNDGTRIMKEWVGHYHGKVIQFETDTEKFYLVVADGKNEGCRRRLPRTRPNLQRLIQNHLRGFHRQKTHRRRHENLGTRAHWRGTRRFCVRQTRYDSDAGGIRHKNLVRLPPQSRL